MAGRRQQPTKVKDLSVAQIEEQLGEVDEEFYDVWHHRLGDETFVRAFNWAHKKGNGVKACVLYADAHSQDFSEGDTPVVKKDDAA